MSISSNDGSDDERIAAELGDLHAGNHNDDEHSELVVYETDEYESARTHFHNLYGADPARKSRNAGARDSIILNEELVRTRLDNLEW